MPTTTIPVQYCPQCARQANKYAFGPSKNYLGCSFGHVFPAVITTPPDFVTTI